MARGALSKCRTVADGTLQIMLFEWVDGCRADES